jgi:hypothetical protein
MVLIWNRISSQKIERLSGLTYLRKLLETPELHEPGAVMWVMASAASSACNLEWIRAQGIEVPDECVYVAPMYQGPLEDPELVARVELLRPRHIILTLGGGTQEQLGLYLKRALSYRAGIHCVGAAIAFLSGDQVYIPRWADRLYLGWLFRIAAQPHRFLPRYWGARKLLGPMLRYRERLPEMLE